MTGKVSDEVIAADFKALLERAAAAVGRHETEVAKARADQNLSAAGRAEKEHASAKALRKAFAELRGQTVNPLVEWATARRKGLVDFGRLRRSANRDEAMIEEMRHAELRRRIEAKDPITWRAEYEAGNDTLRAAMELDPAGRLLPEEFILEQAERRSRQMDSKSWEEMEQAELLAATMNGSISALEVALGPDPDAPMREPAA